MKQKKCHGCSKPVEIVLIEPVVVFHQKCFKRYIQMILWKEKEANLKELKELLMQEFECRILPKNEEEKMMAKAYGLRNKNKEE